jgi:mannose-1-phosphate guanylyltransferase
MAGSRSRNLWGVVLAGGSGTRLASLTRALYGFDLPKQFACLHGNRSLLQLTLERISPVIAPSRTVVVVTREFEAVARDQLAAYPEVELAVQPANVGTAPGILFPASRIRAINPRATVAFFPSDHHIPHPEPFLRALRTAVQAVRRRSGLITLLGAEAETPEVEYGWIVPGAAMAESFDVPVRTVRHFVEKPAEEMAARLCGDGALWNTFVSVGRISTYWKLGRRHLRECTDLLDTYVRRIGQPDEDAALDAAYDRLSAADFSRDILERAERLGVVSVAGSGWSDWGRPERVLETLRSQGTVDALLERVSSSVRTSILTSSAG